MRTETGKEAFILILILVFLSGCGGMENGEVSSSPENREVSSRTENGEASSEPGNGEVSSKPENVEASSEPEDKEAVYGDEESGEDIPEEADMQYPLIAMPSSVKWIDLVLVSEGNYCIFDGEKFGFVTEGGEEIAPCIYDTASPFSEGLACVSKGNKYGYIDPEGEVAIPFDYDRATPFVEGLAYFAAGDTYGFMDKSGEQVFFFECDSVSSFQEGLAWFSRDGRYGYIDRNGQIAIEPIFDDAGYFKEGLAEVMKGGRYGVINRDGTLIVAAEYDSVYMDGSFIIAQSNGKYDCFDRTGNVLLEQADYIMVRGDYICFGKGGKLGASDGKGNILIEPLYDWMSLLPNQNLWLVLEDERYGVVDLQGEVRLPVVYKDIFYDSYLDSAKGGMLLLTDMEGNRECMDASDFSVRIPCIYDSIDWMDENRAVVTQDGRSGIMDREGNMIEPAEYDTIRFFADGAVWMQKGSKTWFYNSSGEAVENIGCYDDISLKGNCYQTKKDGKYGFLNGAGEEVIPPVYDSVLDYQVYGSGRVYILTEYNGDLHNYIMKTGEPEWADISGALLQNEITPGNGFYQEFAGSGSISVGDAEGGHTVSREELREYKKIYKLYDLDHSGETLLFFKAIPYIKNNFPMSYSGFYVIRDGRAEELVTGYECGGSLRGDYACLWYDRETCRVLPGTNGFWGGFGGYCSSGVVYGRKDGEMESIVSFGWINQPVAYYSDEELEHAELLYDEEDRPYSKEEVAQADKKLAQKFSVDGIQTSIEEYREVSGRYQILSYVE